MHRIDRAGKAGLCDHRQPLGLRFGQLGVGDDHRERGVFHRCRGSAALDAHAQHVRRKRLRRSAAAIFAIAFKRRRPEPRPIADRDAADRVDHRKRSDPHAAQGLRRCRSDPALEIRGGGAEPGADAAEREIRSRRCGALSPPFRRSNMIAPGTIGMTAPPTAKPRPCSASQACTPPPASSPNAEPPPSAMASIRSTVLARSSSAPSRVPGPPPRTSIAATAG